MKSLKVFMYKHKSSILIGMGLCGFIFSNVYTVKATIKATKKVEAEKKRLNKDKLTAKETFKVVWKYYIPTLVSTAISVPCVILGNKVTSKRCTALATAYTVSEAALQQYQDKTKEILGSKKAQEIHESISKDNVENAYEKNKQSLVLPANGDSLFYEPLTDRYIVTNWNKLQKAVNDLNATALTDVYNEITLSQWFEAIGLDSTTISDEIGWSAEKGIQGLIDISLDCHLTKDNVACAAIYYNHRPKHLD